jgi:hypothetical protein
VNDQSLAPRWLVNEHARAIVVENGFHADGLPG